MTDKEKINWVYFMLQEVCKNRNTPTQDELETALGFLEDVIENVP